MDALEQFARVNFQGTGELHDIFNSEVALPAFDSGVPFLANALE